VATSFSGSAEITMWQSRELMWGGGAEIDKEVEFPVRNGSHVFGVKVLLEAV
jgi:hypothetical protein